MKLTTEELSIRSGGAVTVSSKIPNGAIYLGDTSLLGSAGNLEIIARNIVLDTSAQITSQTDLGNGGNINLLLNNLLLMRRGSQISTSAGRLADTGDGGNITIDNPSGFIVAPPFENNDITANAFSGSGGKVQINAISLFGTAPRSREDLARQLGINDTNSSLLDSARLPTSDITAISQENPTLNGTVNINTLDDSTNRIPINLPTKLVEQKIVQSCSRAIARGESQFVVTGRGGIPTNPIDTIRTNTTLSPDWVIVNTSNRKNPEDFTLPSARSINVNSKQNYPTKIVEAQSWVRSSNGDVYLVSKVPYKALSGASWKSGECAL